ncbi:MAG: hypothetical protein Q8Q60_00865 [Candidatus Chromulinivorax sp.]|nr:hypothetical protein [Candidatus Chromulinivorax sp.]
MKRNRLFMDILSLSGRSLLRRRLINLFLMKWGRIEIKMPPPLINIAEDMAKEAGLFD